MFPYMEICQLYFVQDEYCFPCAFVEGMCRIVFLKFKPWRKYMPHLILLLYFCRLRDPNWWWPFLSNFVIPIWIPDGIFLETLSRIPKIHLWCDTSQPLGGLHGSRAVSSTYLHLHRQLIYKETVGVMSRIPIQQKRGGDQPSLTGSY